MARADHVGERIRLDALLARNLVGVGKGAARALCDDGEVRAADGAALDGRQWIALGALPLAVTIDGAPHTLHAEAHVLLHKPRGVVTALVDERHPTAYALVREAPLAPYLRPMGRLDLDTTGLLLWTTDGTLLSRLTHPKRAVPRTYHAALASPYQTPPRDLVLEDGHRPNLGGLATISEADAHPALTRTPHAAIYASVTLTGGAYHEVRRLFTALGSHVLALCRVSFGALVLPPGLAAGAFQEIPDLAAAVAGPEG